MGQHIRGIRQKSRRQEKLERTGIANLHQMEVKNIDYKVCAKDMSVRKQRCKIELTMDSSIYLKMRKPHGYLFGGM